jgi:F0F1-type ATP synthase membrane subunit b/b'
MNSLATMLTAEAGNLLLTNAAEPFPWWKTCWSAFNLALIAFIIWYFGRHKFREFFKSRHEQIESDINSSAARLKNAEANALKAKEELARVDDKVAGFQEKLKAEIEAIHLDEKEQLEIIKKLLEGEYQDRVLAEKIELNKEIFAEFLKSLFDDAKRKISKENSQVIHQKLIDNLLSDLNGSAGQEIAKAVKGEF